MPVRNEDVSIRRSDDVAGPIEGVGSVAGNPCLTERHQHLSFRAEFEYLVTLAIFAGRVGRPDVAVAVDMETVRLIEHSLAKHLQDLARRIELNDRCDVRALAGASPAPLKRPDIAIAVDFDPDGRTPLPTFRELGPALFNTIRIVLRVCLRCEHRHRDDDCNKVENPST